MNFRKKSRSRRNSTLTPEIAGKWRMPSKRISRISSFEYDSDDDEPPKAVTNWMEEFFGRHSGESDSLADQDMEIRLTTKQTLILSTFVPDEILLLEKYESGEPKRFVGVLMMADVSGYTALSERYNNTGKGGTYRLTATLNTYLGALVEIIYGHGGDIIKFAGDAFLALWKTDKRTYLSHTIHSVIACALVIQHTYAIYETDVKVNLKVKLAISAGNIMFAPIGKGIDMNYVIIGLPVLEAKLAESLCTSGEVKLTPNAWGHCYSRNYDHILHEDGHVTIKSILYDPHEKDVTKPFLGFGALLRQVKKPNSVTFENLSEIIWESSKSAPDMLNLRPSIAKAEGRHVGSQIRNFMIRPVLTQIDAHQPLEYLTEMRQVSILFVTLKPRDCPPLQLITIVNNSYQITCEIVYKSMGCVNKIILFDKDVMILVVFGLRGFKHESEAQAALKCAYGIKKSVSALDGVLEVSVGVTTGQVYCGVVGHPLRREFTVIGAIVNKAARLMCSYRNKISCDEATFVKSKMSKNGFTLQPQIELKGIGHPGKIYEYTEDIRVKELYNIPLIPPLLDREDETEYFENWLDQSRLSYRDFEALLLIGEPRIGKSRMLEWLARIAKNKGFHVLFISLTSIHSANPYLALSQLINQMLDLTEPITGFLKEQKIVEMLKIYDEDLCYLNNIIKTRFAYNEGVYSMDEQKRKEKAQVIFKKLIDCVEDTYVILFDDLHNLDPSTWEYITIIFNSMKFFTVFTVTRGKFSSVHQWLYSVFTSDSIRKIVLGSLTSRWIPPLACQILDVDAVPIDLCNALRMHCKGMPGLVESFIVHLFSNGAIEIMQIKDEDLKDYVDEDLQFPNPLLLKPLALDRMDQEVLNALLENDTETLGEISICVVTNKLELHSDINVNNVDALIMIQIDSLTPYQQLLLKIASVIGYTISRDLLENIMYENNPLTTAKAIKRLFAMRILSCANAKSNSIRNKKAQSNTTLASVTASVQYLTCDCYFEYNEGENELPKYAYCKVMKFRNRNSRNTCYELLPLNQKKEFHSRIICYLENNKQKCSECGGTLMILQTENITDEGQGQNLSPVPSTADNRSEASVSMSAFKPKESIRETKSEVMSGAPSEIVNLRMSSSESTRSKYIEGDPTKGTKTKRVTISSIKSIEEPNESQTFDGPTVFENFRLVVDATNIGDWHHLGIIDSQDAIDMKNDDNCKNTFTVTIEKGISEINLKKCTCSDLTILIYEQLVHHSIQAELKKKAIEFAIHLSYLSFLEENIHGAYDKLDLAEGLCQEEPNIAAHDLRRFLGRIYSLRAACALMQGNLLVTKSELERASKIYKLNMKQTSRMLNLKSIFRIRSKKLSGSEKKIKSDSVFCLNIATLLYSTLGDEKTSRTCAYQALNVIQRVNSRVVDVCDAFANAIQVELDRGYPEGTPELEKFAKHVFRHLPQPLVAEDLFSLGKLYLAIFRARICRADMAPAVRSGFRALVVCNFLHVYNVSQEIIPDLFYVLLTRRRIEEAIDVLKLSMRLAKEQGSRVCETWYYALCMDLILDGGFQLESPTEIQRFAEFSLHKNEHFAARRRLVVNLWTYWLRVDAERKAKRFEDEVFSWLARDDDDASLTTLLSALRLAEGMLESLARKMDELKRVVDLMELRSIADRELNVLEKECRIMRIAYPRWIRLRASSLTLSGNQAANTTLLNQALEEGRRQGNYLEEALARAALSNSRFWIQNARVNNFMPWRTGAKQARESWQKIQYKITTTRN